LVDEALNRLKLQHNGDFGGKKMGGRRMSKFMRDAPLVSAEKLKKRRISKSPEAIMPVDGK